MRRAATTPRRSLTVTTRGFKPRATTPVTMSRADSIGAAPLSNRSPPATSKVSASFRRMAALAASIVAEGSITQQRICVVRCDMKLFDLVVVERQPVFQPAVLVVRIFVSPHRVLELPVADLQGEVA